MVTITGPYPRPCGHRSFPTGMELAITVARKRWLDLIPCDGCRRAGWEPTENQIKAIVTAARSEGRSIPKEYQGY